MPKGVQPGARHLPPIPGAWFMPLDSALVVLAGILAKLLLDALHGPSFATLDVLPAHPQGFWVAWTAAQAVLVPVGLYAAGQYRMLSDIRRGWSFPRITLVLLAAFLGVALFLYALGQPVRETARVEAQFVLAMLLLGAWRALMQRRLRAQVLRGERVRNCLLVGDDEALDALARELLADPLYGRRIVGFARSGKPPSAPLPEGSWGPPGATAAQATVENALHQPKHLWAAYATATEAERASLIDGLGVEEMMLGNRVPEPELAAWLRLAQERGVDAHLVPRHHLDLGIVPSPWKLGAFAVMDVHSNPINRLEQAAKRTLDMLVAALALVLASPLLVACVIAIKLENPRGPMFYGGRRVGLKGRHFRQWKLATMRPDADAFREQLLAKNAREGPWFQLDEANDPRISKVGRVLRKYSLNDLPQFWNVLMGDMSLVGPRPLAPDEASRFVQYDFRYYQCFDVKPGITGLWQVSDRMDPSFERRFQLDLEYIRKWSFTRDLVILVKTPMAMLKGGR
ncbi:MAG TPA: exopolysaccharide biosynthesis polyprenyl glycosylphosphotransferase [Candidatus Thermoplasmatota archaeon]|nr:exopolysaccharide biosynthesis polyprenyl glycosylphosphotransferase [Candidatus Thermoplasmatota archaeon]